MKDKSRIKDIAWNADRKKEKDDAREKEKALALIGKHYEAFKTELCAKRRSLKEVRACLAKFRQDIVSEANYLRDNGLGDFTSMTLDIVNQHLAPIDAALDTTRNNIIQHTPVTEVMQGAVPKTAEFRNRQELETIDFVRHFIQQPGYTGLVFKMVPDGIYLKFYLLATYAEGDSWLVGTMINETGLDDLVEMSDEPEVKP